MAGTARDVRDVYGRRSRLGLGDRMLLGYSRTGVAAAAGATMLAAGGTQYGFGMFSVRLGTQPWGPVATGLGFAAWLACQAAAAGTLPWLRRRLGVTPAKSATFGAVGCAVGLLFVSKIAAPAGALALYAVTAGTGAGLVCGTCVEVVADWFPGRRVPGALVSGAFGFGAVPVVLAMAGRGDPAVPLSVLAWVIVVVTALCAPVLRPPPRPVPRLVPRRSAHDLPVRPVPVGWVLAALALGGWAVAAVDITAIPSFALAHGWRLSGGAIALAAFAAASGGVRAPAARMLADRTLADRAGRRVAVLAGGGAVIAQLLLAFAGQRQILVLFWVAAAGAGAATGTWFALLPELGQQRPRQQRPRQQ